MTLSKAWQTRISRDQARHARGSTAAALDTLRCMPYEHQREDPRLVEARELLNTALHLIAHYDLNLNTMPVPTHEAVCAVAPNGEPTSGLKVAEYMRREKEGH